MEPTTIAIDLATRVFQGFCRSKERGANETNMTSTAYVANE
jgi:hypothetical protein